jgi:putative ABC transport system permease protein
VFVAFDREVPAVLPSALAAIGRAHSTARIGRVQLIEDAIAQSIQPRRISALAASAFALAALVLVAVGLFGLVAHTTGWRTRELGIRLALGATPRAVLRLVLAEQLGAVLAGVAAGAVVAAWTVRLLASYMYGIAPYDIKAWTAAIVVILAAAALGAVVPALRASRIDPVRALRTE